MPAPTLVSQSGSTWNDLSTADEVTGSITWSAGDLILVVGWTEDQTVTLNTPTATGLTFSALGSPITTGSSCWVHTWTATAGSGGSGAVTGPRLAGTGSANRGIHALVYSGHSGTGARAAPAASSAQTVSLTRTGANSAVVCVSADWSATGIGGLGGAPAGQTQLRAADAVNCEAFLAHWGDQGAAGTTSYGTTGLSGTQFSKIAVEILGTASTATQVQQPVVVDAPARLRPGRALATSTGPSDVPRPPAPVVVAAPRPPRPSAVVVQYAQDVTPLQLSASPPPPVVVERPATPQPGRDIVAQTAPSDVPPAPAPVVVDVPVAPRPGRSVVTSSIGEQQQVADTAPPAVVVAAPRPRTPGTSRVLWSQDVTPLQPSDSPPPPVVVARPATPRPGAAIVARQADTPAVVDTPPPVVVVAPAGVRRPGFVSVDQTQPSDEPPPPRVVVVSSAARPAGKAATVARSQADPLPPTPPIATVVVGAGAKRAGAAQVHRTRFIDATVPDRNALSAPTVTAGRGSSTAVLERSGSTATVGEHTHTPTVTARTGSTGSVTHRAGSSPAVSDG